MEYSFAPLADGGSKILILGSLPGVVSIRHGEYYAHPQNRFWKIIFGVFNVPFRDSYAAKLALLRNRHIALWDVVKCAERAGSSDTAIKDETPNDIPLLLGKYRGIESILFNGAKSYNSYKRHFGVPALRYKLLLSTSPACAGRDTERFRMWEEALLSADV